MSLSTDTVYLSLAEVFCPPHVQWCCCSYTGWLWTPHSLLCWAVPEERVKCPSCPSCLASSTHPEVKDQLGTLGVQVLKDEENFFIALHVFIHFNTSQYTGIKKGIIQSGNISYFNQQYIITLTLLQLQHLLRIKNKK